MRQPRVTSLPPARRPGHSRPGSGPHPSRQQGSGCGDGPERRPASASVALAFCDWTSQAPGRDARRTPTPGRSSRARLPSTAGRTGARSNGTANRLTPVQAPCRGGTMIPDLASRRSSCPVASPWHMGIPAGGTGRSRDRRLAAAAPIPGSALSHRPEHHHGAASRQLLPRPSGPSAATV